MERLSKCDIIIDILAIDKLFGGNQEFTLVVETCGNGIKELVFSDVLDLRYSIENASIERFHRYREHLPIGLSDNSIYEVENSHYLEYFEKQVDGTIQTDGIIHYVICDKTDTTIDVLARKKPTLRSL